MTANPLNPGDEIDAVVTTVTPFGVLVQTDAGVPGLVRGARDGVGSMLRVRVVEYDAAERRFAATI